MSGLILCAAFLVVLVLPAAQVALLAVFTANGATWDRMEYYGHRFRDVWHPEAYRMTLREIRGARR